MIINAGDHGFNWDDVSYWWFSKIQGKLNCWVFLKSDPKDYVELVGDDAEAFQHWVIYKANGGKL